MKISNFIYQSKSDFTNNVYLSQTQPYCAYSTVLDASETKQPINSLSTNDVFLLCGNIQGVTKTPGVDLILKPYYLTSRYSEDGESSMLNEPRFQSFLSQPIKGNLAFKLNFWIIYNSSLCLLTFSSIHHIMTIPTGTRKGSKHSNISRQ